MFIFSWVKQKKKQVEKYANQFLNTRSKFFFTLYIVEKFCGQLEFNSGADAILFVYILTLLNFANSF